MVTESKRAAPLRREVTPPDVEWSVAALGWERDSRFSGHWPHNWWLEEETERSLHANVVTPSKHRGLGPQFKLRSAHIVLIRISCVQVNTAVKKLKLCLSLDSIPFNLKIFICANIPSKSVFQSWRKRSYRLDILSSRTLFSIFFSNMNIILFSSLGIQYLPTW